MADPVVEVIGKERVFSLLLFPSRLSFSLHLSLPSGRHILLATEGFVHRDLCCFVGVERPSMRLFSFSS